MNTEMFMAGGIMKLRYLILTICLQFLWFGYAGADFDPDDYIDRDFIPMNQPELPLLDEEKIITVPDEYTSPGSYSRPESEIPKHPPPRAPGLRPLPEAKRPPVHPVPRTFHVEDGSVAYQKGTAAYDKKRYREAVRWFLRGADLGDVRSMVTLGNMFEFGKVVRKNPVRAAVMYTIAAEKGSSEGERRRKKIEAKLSSTEKQRVRRLLRTKDRSALIRTL